MQDLRCQIPNHNKKKFVSLSLQDKAEKRLFCFLCQNEQITQIAQSQVMNQSQIDIQNLLCDLDEVMEGNQYTVSNWPADNLGATIKQSLTKYKTPDQQKKEIEEFFGQFKAKLMEQLETIKGLLIESLSITQFYTDEKIIKQDEKKEDKKEDKKDNKKDNKKDTKKDTKKDDKKEIDNKNNKDQKKDDDKPDLTASIDNLKKYYEQVYDLTKIKQIIKENSKVDPKILTDKLSEYLCDPKRKESWANMKIIYEQFSKSWDQNSNISTNREQFEQYKLNVDSSLSQWSVFFGQVNWTLQVSLADQSNLIKMHQPGQDMQGYGSKSQIVYSSKPFKEGQHGCLLVLTEIDNKRVINNGNFTIGIVSDDNKDKPNYGKDYRKCLFNGVGEGLVAKIGSDFNAAFKVAPKLIAIKLDVDKNYFEVSDGKRSVAYGLDRDVKLQGQQWRIYIWWREAADRIKIMHSY